MREILFRGRREDGKGWIYGAYAKFRNVANEVYAAIMPEEESENIITRLKRVIPETVGQYTGSKDRNVKQIFEGDICRYTQTDKAKRNGKLIICTGKVIYNVKTASYAVESKDEAGCKYFDYFPVKDMDVIGNIHDNPELLEVEHD